MLNVNLAELGLVHGHEEVSWENTSLSCVCGSQIEIEHSWHVTVFSILLYQLFVDDGARGRIGQSALIVFHKESLSDPLVDDHDSNLRLLRHLVVELADDLPKLGDFFGKHLLAHRVANAITVDDVVCRLLAAVRVGEGGDRLTNELLHPVLDNLLAFWNQEVVRVILTHRRVSAGSETYH